MLPACRTEGEGFSIPTFDFSPFAVQKVQKLNFWGPELRVDCPLSP